jgi:hypothetical protein
VSDTVQITASVPIDGSGKAPAPGAEATPPGGAAAPPGGVVPPAGGAAADGAAAAGAGNTPAGAAAAPPVNPNELTKPPEPALGTTKTEEQTNAEAATGLDLTPFAQEFNANGKLSDESYKALEAKGFSRHVADTYIAGVQAQVTARLTTLSEAVGGVDNYNAILNWGKTGLSEGEKAEAVKMLSGGSPDAAKTYLAGLNARFVAANGKVPGKMAGGGAAPSEDVFNSRAEQAKAMKDPRYKTDAAFRQTVIEKSVRSFSKGSRARVKAPAKSAASRRRTSTNTRRAHAKGKR